MWPPYTISNSESQTPLLRFLLRGEGVCTQAISLDTDEIMSKKKSNKVPFFKGGVSWWHAKIYPMLVIKFTTDV